jgi:formate hydrogenlyase subunit 6/NADH:ubiquinone oxidoreductase subunit I
MPACYHCQFKGIDRKSDITLGDFWGIRNFHKLEEEQIKKGVSIILTHSDIGEKWLEKIKNNCTVFESNKEIFRTSNIYLIHRAKKPVGYKSYRKKIISESLNNILEKIESTKKIRNIIEKVKYKLIWERTKQLKGLPTAEYCYGCGACKNACKVNAIEMKADDLGFLHAETNTKTCINCGKCMAICPQRAGNG